MQYQIGLNATNFIKSFIVPNNNGFQQTPYSVVAKVFYNYLPKYMVGIRTGVGYSDDHYYSKSEQNNSVNAQTRTTTNFRIGIESQYLLSNRWAIHYGIDYVWEDYYYSSDYSYTSSNGSQNASRSESKAVTSGFGPVMGVQFNISKHFCLGTELSAYFTNQKGNSSSSNYSTNTGYTESKSNTDGRNTEIVLPGFVYVSYVF